MWWHKGQTFWWWYQWYWWCCKCNRSGCSRGQGLTGSVIGVDLVNGGGGYTFPPFVEIEDECGGGYGATAKAVIDYDPDSPTYQQITDIYIVTEGENYTPPKDIPIDEDFILDDEKGPIIIDGGKIMKVKIQ